jgi:SAM-dependent methyltransferase
MADDKSFTGSIPKIYETHLVPLLFEDYAADLARRVAARAAAGQRVLEVAAGTGVVTRAMLRALPAGVDIIATDLNPAMLDQAAAHTMPRPVAFQQADAMQLPFDDQSVDVVVCQFGVMFFPDKGKAMAEMRRVLRPRGVAIFNVWDRIEDNEYADATEAGLAVFFPNDPPRFLSRAPYGYYDREQIAADIAAGGFIANPALETIAQRSRARLASDAAVGYCQGSPLRGEIESRGALEHATDAAAAEIAKRFGSGASDTKIQAIVVTVEK